MILMVYLKITDLSIGILCALMVLRETNDQENRRGHLGGCFLFGQQNIWSYLLTLFASLGSGVSLLLRKLHVKEIQYQSS